MSLLATQSFVANAKSTVVMDRPFTEDELTSVSIIKQNAIAAGEQASAYTQTIDAGTYTSVSYYSNIATANAVVAAYLAFVPAPISAVAEAV